MMSKIQACAGMGREHDRENEQKKNNNAHK